MEKADHIIFFDGVCNLCHGFVQFVIKRDKDNTFHFASLQSEIAKRIIPDYISEGDPETVIYWHDGKILEKSSAALAVIGKLNGLWPLLSYFKVLPKFLRDPVYMFIARNRYKWFGRKEVCEVPRGVDKGRIIE